MQHCFFRDRNWPVPFNAVNLQARKVVQYVMSWGEKTNLAGGHGTHVAGSIAGDTEEGSNEFAGMAPKAKIGELFTHGIPYLPSSLSNSCFKDTLREIELTIGDSSVNLNAGC